MTCQTPIAIIIFRRPDITTKVFEAIRQAQPKKLFIIADGPRADRPGEAEKCAQTRSIFEQIDWDCEVFKQYSETNLGCRENVTQGISWVFEQVEEAIIFEDDCLPHPDFFVFCENLLEKYRDDLRISHISGNNHLINYRKQFEYSYYYSRYPLIWGWATWRRAWKSFDPKMKNCLDFVEGGWLERFLDDRRGAYVWDRSLRSIPENWDYQWIFTCWTQGGLAINPHVNLVSNIGFGNNATHTFDPSNLWSNLPVEALSFPLKHPPFMIRDADADRHLQNTMYDPSKINKLSMLINKILT